VVLSQAYPPWTMASPPPQDADDDPGLPRGLKTILQVNQFVGLICRVCEDGGLV
jgi:hypothetical protein